MSDGIWAAASGAMGQTLALDVAAENIANASTPGYHVDRAVFRDMLTRAHAKRSGGFNLVYGQVGSITTDPTAGAFVPTGRPLDVALKGGSYLVVKTPRGERYTRHGSIQLAQDGTLTTREGDPLLDPNRKPIKVSPTSKLAVAPDGNVLVDGSRAARSSSFRSPTRARWSKRERTSCAPSKLPAKRCPRPPSSKWVRSKPPALLQSKGWSIS
jgi:flagellar basal-body rod protein FlgF